MLRKKTRGLMEIRCQWPMNVVRAAIRKVTLGDRRATRMVKGEVGELHHYLSIVQQIRMLIRQNCNVVFQHTLREGNSCADFLTNERFRTWKNLSPSSSKLWELKPLVFSFLFPFLDVPKKKKKQWVLNLLLPSLPFLN